MTLATLSDGFVVLSSSVGAFRHSLMAGMENFVDAPCEGFLDRCAKDQLLEIAGRYNVDLAGLGDRWLKKMRSLWLNCSWLRKGC